MLDIGVSSVHPLHIQPLEKENHGPKRCTLKDLGKAVFFFHSWKGQMEFHAISPTYRFSLKGHRDPSFPKPQLYLLGFCGRHAISPDTIEKTSPSLTDPSIVTTPQVIRSNLEANPISIHVYGIFTYVDVAKNRGGPPKWMVKIMENPIKMGWFGGKTHHFRKHPYGDYFLTIIRIPIKQPGFNVWYIYLYI